MMTIRPAQERGHTQLPWLDSRLSFSFGEYYDPNQRASASRIFLAHWGIADWPREWAGCCCPSAHAARV